MTAKIVVGLDGGGGQGRAINQAQKLAEQIGSCELLLVYVVEWSPFSFQTAEENAERHKRREEEIATATSRVVDPAVSELEGAEFDVRGIVRHGNVSDVLEQIAKEEAAEMIVVARTSEQGISQRIFGSSTANLVMHASVPVVVVP